MLITIKKDAKIVAVLDQSKILFIEPLYTTTENYNLATDEEDEGCVRTICSYKPKSDDCCRVSFAVGDEVHTIVIPVKVEVIYNALDL